MTRTVNQDRGLRGPARVGLWLLPAYGLLLTLSTITHQPSVERDFTGYARYITTDQFLVSHLVASIGGAALATLGAMSAVVFLAAGRARRLALTGAVVTVVANVYLAATFGAASFVQPGIGRAFLRGMPGVEELNADTAYGSALVATIAATLVTLLVGTVLLGTAIARTDPALRWVGIGYAVSLVIFSFSGVLGFGTGTQPAAGLLLAASTVVLARRLPRLRRTEDADGRPGTSGATVPSARAPVSAVHPS
jgi:hypothetical protein